MKTLADPHVRASLIDRLRRLRPENTRRWGHMSAHQMVCHLCDSARMALGERQVSPATGLPQRTVVKWLALYAPLQWPSGIVTRPEVDPNAGGTPPQQFSADIEMLEHLTSRLIEAQLESHAHPIFGKLSRTAWLRWAYLHMDHHLRQFGV